MCCAASTLVPRAVLTWDCARREQGSFAGAPYNGREMQMLRTQRKAKAREDEYFEYMNFSSNSGQFYTLSQTVNNRQE
jgi:hypothetical protein